MGKSGYSLLSYELIENNYQNGSKCPVHFGENQPYQVKVPQREPSFGASNLAGKGGIKWAVGIVLVCHSNANMGYPGE